MKSKSSLPPATSPSPEAQRALDSLREAVRDAFEKKRRLGQYAVVWEDGEIRSLHGDELAVDRSTSNKPG